LFALVVLTREREGEFCDAEESGRPPESPLQRSVPEVRWDPIWTFLDFGFIYTTCYPTITISTIRKDDRILLKMVHAFPFTTFSL
jgi:hypothetical protein